MPVLDLILIICVIMLGLLLIYKLKALRECAAISGAIIVGGSQKDDFPYICNHISDIEIKNKFNNLIEYKPNIEHNKYNVHNIKDMHTFEFQNVPTIIVNPHSDYKDYNLLSDYFQESCRMKCIRSNDDVSPFDYWNKNKKYVFTYAKEKYGNTDNYSLRESIYELTSECSSFRPTLMVSMINMFGGKVILDFSSGWGDRLIGAMACDNKIDFYCGVDPNTCVHPHYQKMISFFKKDPTKYVMINKPFQKAKIPNKKYNMILTSPPYFTFEKYTTESTQSTHSSNSLNSWMSDFLFFSLKKSWKVLEPGGHMIISINNMRDHNSYIKYVEKMIEFVNAKLKKSEYLGVIAHTEKRDNNTYKSPQPLWIWKKKTNK
jgi:hypothetical protein